MVITNTEHPPASGIALGLVINEWTFHTIIFILVGVFVLFLVKRFLGSILIDLR
jgi:hypothetical protein